MAQETQSVVSAIKLSKVFRDFWLREKVTAVSELDLDVQPREVFGLLGPNGSGKSTTIKMILGLLFPTRGRISIYGRPPTDVAVKSRIGFLPEESYLYPFLDAHETLDFYGRLFRQPRPERRRRTEMLLDMVGLSSVAYRRVGEYSKGMQRRIGLAQALINDPDLLILDEPTSGMDPIGTRQFKDLIRTLAARGKTIILSSHLLADVEDVCDRVCILYGGKERAAGRIDDLLAQNTMTQFTVERLDEQTLRRIRVLLGESGRELLNVGTPRDRLESLFLRIVKEAQEQRVRTGGATAGGNVAAFLRGEGDQADGKHVIEELLTSHARLEKVQEQEDSSAKAAQSDAAGHDQAQAGLAIDELINPPQQDVDKQPVSASKSAGGASTGRPATPQTQVDRGLIDGLLGSDKQEDSDR